MVQIKKDKYVLGQSVLTQLDENNKKIKMNIQLQLASAGIAIAASVAGKVVDSSNANVSGALVSIMDANYQPLIHTLTDSSGNYSFAAVPASSSYNIFAIGAGKQLNQGQSFTIATGTTVTRNFTLATEASAALGVIVGDIIKAGTITPVSGAVVTLHVSGPGETLTAIAYTNEFGQYAFRDIPIGNYFIEINGLGCISKRISSVNIATAGQILNQDINLDADPNASKATISGLITDSEGNVIPRADTILYSVASDGTLTAVAYNKTNSNGVYLFYNVAQGNYRVKSNFMESVDYTIEDNASRPNVDSLILSQGGSEPAVVKNGIDFTLGGAATYTSSIGFVQTLGNNTGGTATTTVNVSLAGDYIIDIKYYANTVRPLRVDVNGTYTGTDHQVPAAGDSANPVNTVGTFSIPVTLIAGSNTIKFYNSSTTVYAPDIRTAILTQAPFTVSKAISDYTLGGGALYDGSVGGITAIGGMQQGTVSFVVNAPVAGSYNCVVNYRSNINRVLRVDLNGGWWANVNVPTNDNWNGYLTIPLTLAKGATTVKYSNDNIINNAPDLRGSVVTQVRYNDVQEAETATLGGTAAASNGFVTGLGGSGGGSVTMTKTVPYSGDYDLTISYVSTTANTKLKVIVNGVTLDGRMLFQQTPTNNAADRKWTSIRVPLNSGANTIKIM